MLIGERWTNPDEIKNAYRNSISSKRVAGTPVYYDKHQKYVNDKTIHSMVLGNTGEGKSQCVSIPFVDEIISNNESGVILDTKGEIYNYTSHKVPKHYNKYILDFSNISNSPDTWNVLSLIKNRFDSNDKSENDLAMEDIYNIAYALYEEKDPRDKFWVESPKSVFMGVVQAMAKYADLDECNIRNVISIISNIRKTGTNIVNALPKGSTERQNISVIAHAAKETAGSIYSILMAGFGGFLRSESLLEFLDNDSIDIYNFYLENPFIIYIILPDESNAYHFIAGLFVSQFSSHIMRKARDYNGTLPIRINFVLEELGSVGKSIPNLPNLAAAGRSRNIRLMLVLQSTSQLNDVYGNTLAESIHACIGQTYLFSSNNENMLEEWSRKCGKKTQFYNGSRFETDLISSSQLQALDVGQCLIKTKSIKYVTYLEMAYKTFDQQLANAHIKKAASQRIKPKTFSASNLYERIIENKYSDDNDNDLNFSEMIHLFGNKTE